jgi:hypothetical protein
LNLKKIIVVIVAMFAVVYWNAIVIGMAASADDYYLNIVLIKLGQQDLLTPDEYSSD